MPVPCSYAFADRLRQDLGRRRSPRNRHRARFPQVSKDNLLLCDRAQLRSSRLLLRGLELEDRCPARRDAMYVAIRVVLVSRIAWLLLLMRGEDFGAPVP